MLNRTFHDVLSHEGAVTIVTQAEQEAYVSNTWNSYVCVEADNKLLIPAARMKQTEKNIKVNHNVLLTVGVLKIKSHYVTKMT